MNETSNYLGAAVITATEAANVAPSIFAQSRAPRTSERYTYVPTGSIVSALAEAGWVAVSARQAHVRDERREGFQLHELKLRRREHIQALNDEYLPELTVTNAHDGSAAYVLHAGIFRRVCRNGLVVSDSTFSAVRFAHRGLTPEGVTQASLEIVAAIPGLVARIESFKSAKLTDTARIAFALRALGLRYAEGRAPVNPQAILTPRRYEDGGNSVWSTLNVVQEHLFRGGASDGHRTSRGTRRSIRRLSGIRASVDTNKGLWALAEEFSLTA